jgi:hypothetical protein
MLLKFAQEQLHTPPARLGLQAIDAPLIVEFLDHLEKHRGLSVRSRNLRLTAGPRCPDPTRVGYSQ